MLRFLASAAFPPPRTFLRRTLPLSRRLEAGLTGLAFLFLSSVPMAPSAAWAAEGDGVTTYFIGDVYEIQPDGSTIKYLFAGGQRIAAIVTSPDRKTARTFFYHHDHLGSTSVVTDDRGRVVESVQYTPYGSLHGRKGDVNTPQKFTGQRLDPTGLYYYKGRYYDPSIGRFTQPDPYVQHLADPQMLNRYSYARNNPVRYVDPSGHFVFLAALLFVAATAAVTGAIGAAVNVVAAAITGRLNSLSDFAKAAGRGFVAGAAGGATGAMGALIMGPAITGSLMGSIALGAGSGAVGGGVGSVLGGGSFGQGAGLGALTGGVLGGVGHAVGPYVAQTQFGQAAGRFASPLGNLYNQALAPRTSGFDGLLTRAQYGIQGGLARINNAFYPGRPTLSPTQTGSFTYGNPVARRSQEGYLWRAIGPGSDPTSPYFASVQPSSAAEAVRLYNPANTNLTHVQMYHRPTGIIEYVGSVAGGEGTQIVIPNPGAMDVTAVGPPIPFDGE